MHILGDIGNTDTKLFLVSTKHKIIKKLTFPSKNLNQNKLSKYFSLLKPNYQKINKILFCSVVPKSFNLIKKFLSKKTKINCYEVKDLNLKSLIKIKVNYKQVGSDRITNAISLINNKNNFIILDFGTATTFDVLIKNTYSGGIIAPGIRLSLDTLSDKASLIPKIKNYPTTNLSELINKPINKINFENELKVIFEKNLSRMYKINNKVNKK